MKVKKIDLKGQCPLRSLPNPAQMESFPAVITGSDIAAVDSFPCNVSTVAERPPKSLPVTGHLSRMFTAGLKHKF